LTLEELQAAAKADCEIPIPKTAFISSCLTGLRWSDINKLAWLFKSKLRALLLIYKCAASVENVLEEHSDQGFDQYFEALGVRLYELYQMDYMATVRRLGLIGYRISMILSALRILETGDTSSKIICEERDF
jgi:hypothetical protein